MLFEPWFKKEPEAQQMQWLMLVVVILTGFIVTQTS